MSKPIRLFPRLLDEHAQRILGVPLLPREGPPRGGWGPPPARSRALVADHGQPDRRRRRVDHLALLGVRLPRLQFLGGLPLVPAELGGQRDHAGVDAGHQPIGVLPLVAAYRSGFEICPPGLLVVRAVLASYPVALS